jgi:hypothetical protein
LWDISGVCKGGCRDFCALSRVKGEGVVDDDSDLPLPEIVSEEQV